MTSNVPDRSLLTLAKQTNDHHVASDIEVNIYIRVQLTEEEKRKHIELAIDKRNRCVNVSVYNERMFSIEWQE